jgi:hypothetical protein
MKVSDMSNQHLCQPVTKSCSPTQGVRPLIGHDQMMKINELFSLDGKVAIVTGGSRGIGQMIATGLVANGVRTYITARKADACDATAAELSALGHCVSIPR